MTNTALRNAIRLTTASNEMFASWGIPIETASGNGTKTPQKCPSETTEYRELISTLITLRE